MVIQSEPLLSITEAAQLVAFSLPGPGWEPLSSTVFRP